MTHQEFAHAILKCGDVHEASWNGARYAKSWDDVAEEVCPGPWARIISILLFTGYADIWDWCDEHKA